MSEPRIVYEAEFKTFCLFPGNSLYAFSISPELSLEHLYWGKRLEPGYDLRYVSQSTRLAHFTTVELEQAKQQNLFPQSHQSIGELTAIWKQNAPSIQKENDELKERIRYRAWRLMATHLQNISGNTKSNTTKRSSVLRTVKSEPQLPQLDMESSLRRSSSARNFFVQSELKNTSNFDEFEKTRKFLRSQTRKIDALSRNPRSRFERLIGKIGKGALCVEYADQGTGDFRLPSFAVLDNVNGSTISPLRFKCHRIFPGKTPIPGGLPSIRCSSDNEATTLEVTMEDEGSGLEVDLIYVVMHHFDALTRRVVFRNIDQRRVGIASSDQLNPGASDKVLMKACSMTIDFDRSASNFYLLQLSGSWGRERFVETDRLTHGYRGIYSTSGVSSHNHNPFAAITIGKPSESEGEARGFSLVYSGNFLIETNVAETGRLRVNVGIHPNSLSWHLARGRCFYTPEAVLVRSGEGLGGMSRTFHRLFLDHLLPRTWGDIHHPVLLNTWEAQYFDVNHVNVVELARNASQLGVDMIVVDDGWFGKRNDDCSSLGDWTPNLEKFPLGLGALAKDVNGAGCKLGIWLEPEMISGDSNLIRAHPDWFLRVPDRPHQIARNQFVLDMTRKVVRDYLFESISNILSGANIEYIKWDMNRPLTEVFSQRFLDSGFPGTDQALPASGNNDNGWDYCFTLEDYSASGEYVEGGRVWQSETSHLYVLGVYDLQHRVNESFPHVMIENCASGGGRFDPGMLFFSPQIWCSDNTDAIVRIKIQYGTSMVYPARSIGAHVSAIPNHITGNTTRSRTRGFVAMCGTYGFELNTTLLSVADRDLFSEQIQVYKRIVAPIVNYGDLYRLWNPFEIQHAAWMYVTRDKKEAVVFVFSVNSDHWSNLVPRLMLSGLLPSEQYEITEPIPNNMSQGAGNLKIVTTETPVYQLGYPSVTLTGDILMNCGLPIKFYTLDDCVMFHLRCLETSSSCFTSPSCFSGHTRSRQPSLAPPYDAPESLFF